MSSVVVVGEGLLRAQVGVVVNRCSVTVFSKGYEVPIRYSMSVHQSAILVVLRSRELRWWVKVASKADSFFDVQRAGTQHQAADTGFLARRDLAASFVLVVG